MRWLKKVIGLKSKKPPKNLKWKRRPSNVGLSIGKPKIANMPAEDLAALKIQTAFRGYRARKAFSRLRGKARLEVISRNMSTQRQVASTLKHLHSWSKIQNEIRVRRVCMVTEGRLRQKKLENQMKLEAKLHDFEVEWCAGVDTMEEALAKIHLREEAAVKRERALAYAFSHQWRANSSEKLGSYEVGKAKWGWSWKERWIAARPWESRVPPLQTNTKQPPKIAKNLHGTTLKNANTRRITYPPSAKLPAKRDQLVS